MRKLRDNRKQILRDVERAFSSHRGRNGKRTSYSESLRALVLSALAGGMTSGQVAKAAGVSQQSVLNWKNNRTIERPRELHLVGERPALPVESRHGSSAPAMDGLADIKLLSGVSIQVPLGALTSSLITVLNGGSQ